VTARGAAAALLGLCTACSPNVRLSTPEPIAVDVTMRVDIYQHTPPEGAPAGPAAEVEARRRARMAEVQSLKNSRLIGETCRGLLGVIEAPPGEYGAYVRRIVEAENADRLTLMRQIATERGVPLTDAETEQARLWREQSFAGEWIEVPGEGGACRWEQKRDADLP
jgi:hypothetical protein